MIWIAFVPLALAAALWIAFPFLRNGAVEVNDAEGTISVFRDQLDEVDRDHAAGLIGDDERAGAAQEIERRALHAARRLDGGVFVSHRSWSAAAGLAAAVLAVTLGGYAFTGMPSLPDQPLTARKGEILRARAAAGDVNAQITLMIQRTEENPEGFEGWWRLATAYASIGDDASSVAAYRRAAELEPGEPGVQAAYAEAMVLANGNKVPPAARIIFETVLQDTPDPRARYYVALAKAQSQDFRGALESWLALYAESSPDASYMPKVRNDIINMVRFLGDDLTRYLPDATDSEIAAAGGASGAEVNLARIRELEAGLDEDPLDHAAWIELATRLAKNGENGRAAEALTQGAAHFEGAPFVQEQFDEAARELGFLISDETPPDPVAHPTEEEVATMSALPQAQQDEMIDGMVAGLAAELEARPDNPEKWIMLVRSYSFLGENSKAIAAYEKAKAHFAGNPEVLDRLARGVNDVVGN